MTCNCDPESYHLGCNAHWEIAAAALTREVERMPTGTTTRKAWSRALVVAYITKSGAA